MSNALKAKRRREAVADEPETSGPMGCVPALALFAFFAGIAAIGAPASWEEAGRGRVGAAVFWGLLTLPMAAAAVVTLLVIGHGARLRRRLRAWHDATGCDVIVLTSDSPHWRERILWCPLLIHVAPD